MREAAKPASTRVLLALGIPAALAVVQPDWTHAELVRTRPATTYLPGLGLEEQHGEWLAWYRFDDPPFDRSRSLEENLRQEPAPEARLQRVEFRRTLRGDSAVTLWESAIARAVQVAATAATCASFEIGALGVGRELRRGLDAYIPLAGGLGPSRYQMVVSTVTAVAPLSAGEQTGAFVEPERSVLIVTVEPLVRSVALPGLESGLVPCPRS